MILSSIKAHIAAGVIIAAFFHPLHVSVTEIEFDEKDKALEIMMRVFIDDLELSLRNHLEQPGLDVLDASNDMTLDPMIEKYLKSHFRVSLDDKTQIAQYLGHEREGDAFIFYIEVSKVRKWKTIGITNSIITETYDDQSNLINVYVRDQVRSLRLTRADPSGKLTFETK